jgi:hypothetical protein
MNANELLNSVQHAVGTLDLDPVKTRLMNGASGEGWSQAKADDIEQEYRRFLCLTRMYPDVELAPYEDVDTFWHYHILDTVKYAADCTRLFGYFLHHCPHAIANEDDDALRRIESGKRIGILYEASFGVADPAMRSGLAQASAPCICGSMGPGIR